jgi:hypothetical protein
VCPGTASREGRQTAHRSFPGVLAGLPGHATWANGSDGATVGKERREHMIALTTGLVLLPIVAVGVVLAWAEWRGQRRETTVVEPRLTNALLAARDDEGLGSLPW